MDFTPVSNQNRKRYSFSFGLNIQCITATIATQLIFLLCQLHPGHEILSVTATRTPLGPQNNLENTKADARKRCSSEEDCAANEDCVLGVCTTHCEFKWQCDKWEICENNLCYLDKNICPDPGENWDGEKCRHFADSRTAVIVLSVIAGALLLALVVGVYFLAKNGYLPIPGFSRRSSKPIRRTKRIKADLPIEDDDDDKEKNGKEKEAGKIQSPPTLATIDE